MSVRRAVGLGLCWLLSSACEGPAPAAIPLPVYEGATLSEVLGTARDDVWLLGRGELMHNAFILHGTPGEPLRELTPAGVRGDWMLWDQVLTLDRGRLLLADRDPVEGIAVGLLSSTGELRALDTRTIFPEVTDRSALVAQLVTGERQAWLWAYCFAIDHCHQAARLYRLEGERFVEVDAPAELRTLELFGVIDGELWLQRTDERGGLGFLRRTDTGWRALAPARPLWSVDPRLFAPRTREDLWLDGAHWNGSSWSVNLEVADTITADAVGALLVTGPDAAQYVEVVRHQAPGEDTRFTLDARPVLRHGAGQVLSRELEAPACAALPGCGPSTAARLADGSLWFVFGGEGLDAQFILPIDPEAL